MKVQLVVGRVAKRLEPSFAMHARTERGVWRPQGAGWGAP